MPGVGGAGAGGAPTRGGEDADLAAGGEDSLQWARAGNKRVLEQLGQLSDHFKARPRETALPARLCGDCQSCRAGGGEEIRAAAPPPATAPAIPPTPLPPFSPPRLAQCRLIALRTTLPFPPAPSDGKTEKVDRGKEEGGTRGTRSDRASESREELCNEWEAVWRTMGGGTRDSEGRTAVKHRIKIAVKHKIKTAVKHKIKIAANHKIKSRARAREYSW